jgi:palmitoyltransferase
VSANQLDHEGCSLLHWAAINNRLQIASYLIDQGADVNYAGGVLQETPIQWALRKHAVRMVHLLTERGSDLAHKDLDGLDCLALAAQLNQVDLVFFFLSYGADANSTDNDGLTPLIRVRAQCCSFVANSA